MSLVFEFLQKPLAENIRIVDRQLRNAIERSLRLGAHHARNAVEPIHEHVPAKLVFADDFLEVTLRCFQRRLARDLAEGGRAQSCLGEFQRCGKQFFVAGDEGSDTSATHAVAFAHTVDHHHVLLNSRKGHSADVFGTIIAELPVHLITEKEEVVLFDQVS